MFLFFLCPDVHFLLRSSDAACPAQVRVLDAAILRWVIFAMFVVRAARLRAVDLVFMNS
jgi:hypothetical protein